MENLKCVICDMEINANDGDNIEDSLCVGCNIDAEDAAFYLAIDLEPED